MGFHIREEHYSAFKNWLSTIHFTDPFAVTCTYSSAGRAKTADMIRNNVDGSYKDRRLNVHNFQLHSYLRRIDQKLFKNCRRRYNRRTRRVPIFEGDGETKNYHFHLIIDKPEFVSDEEFVGILKREWPWGSVDAQKDTIGYWSLYIAKQQSKDHKLESFFDCLNMDEVNI